MDTHAIYDEEMIKKHENEKRAYKKEIAGKYFDKLEYFMDCEFNLLVFGVGSKRKTINDFAERL